MAHRELMNSGIQSAGTRTAPLMVPPRASHIQSVLWRSLRLTQQPHATNTIPRAETAIVNIRIPTTDARSKASTAKQKAARPQGLTQFGAEKSSSKSARGGCGKRGAGIDLATGFT